MDIEIRLKNGETKKFCRVARPGGSYTNSVKYEGAFVIVTDEWSSTTAYPAADVEMVVTSQERQW